MSPQTPHAYEFDRFRLDASERLLLRDGQVVPLTPKVFDTLLALVERSGHVVGKEELMRRLWPDSFVEESSLSQNIFLLRRALGEAASGRQYIETLPRRGYRFVADLREVRGTDSEEVLREQAGTQILTGEESPQAPDAQAIQDADAAADAGDASPPAPPPSGGRRLKLYASLACAVLLAIAVPAYLSRQRARDKASAGLRPKTVAVLPFKTLGAGGESELLGLGMADALINRLSRMKEPAVLSTGSVFRYAAGDADALDAGREMGVDAVLEGTVQRSGERVRVTARLVSVRDGGTLWAGKFDEQSSNIFALQDSISEQLARALTPRLTADERAPVARSGTRDTEAYQAYLTGLYFSNRRSKDGIAKAIEHYRRAAELDPSYALAYAGLADCYNLNLFNGYHIVPSQEARERRLEATRKALGLDDTLAEAHMVMAAINYEQGDAAGAEREYLRTLELSPSHAIAHVRYAHLLADSSRLEESLREMRRAQELDPVSPITNGALAYTLLLSRRYDESVEYARRAIELNPELADLHFTLGEAYIEKGMYDEAVAEVSGLGDGRRASFLQLSALAYGRAGRRAEAAEALAELRRSLDGGLISHYNLAVIYGALGEMDKAFESLERVRLAPTVRAMIMYSPDLDPLRADPRFADYLRRHDLKNSDD